MPPVRRSSRNRKLPGKAFSYGKPALTGLVEDQVERVMKRIDDEVATGLAKHGRMKEIVEEEKACIPWLTYDVVMGRRRRRKQRNGGLAASSVSVQSGRGQSSGVESLPGSTPLRDVSNLLGVPSSPKRVGRKKGSTKKAKQEKSGICRALKTDCALTKMAIRSADPHNNILNICLQINIELQFSN